jgi:hypothetical protein
MAQMTLAQLRLAGQRLADLENSQFVGTAEANDYVNKALAKVYDQMVTAYGENYYAVTTPAITTITDTSVYLYPLPADFYKGLGADVCLAGSDPTKPENWFMMRPFNFGERNRGALQPQVNQTGVSLDYRYRYHGTQLWLSPVPSAGGQVRLWYAPTMTVLVADGDSTTMLQPGWEELVVLEVAIKMMVKSQLDSSELQMMRAQEVQRLTEAVANRDAGAPSTVVDVYGAGSALGTMGGSWYGMS